MTLSPQSVSRAPRWKRRPPEPVADGERQERGRRGAGTIGPFLNHPTGMFIYGSPWNMQAARGAIFDEDGVAMVYGAMFNYCELNQ